MRPDFITPRRVLDNIKQRQRLAQLAVKTAKGLVASRPVGLDNILARKPMLYLFLPMVST